jgi:hypothetical protein
MRFRSAARWANGPYILWLIREGKVKTIDDIFETLTENLPAHDAYYARYKLPEIVSDLVDAGLVEIKDSQLAVTPLVAKIQAVLNLSLRDLSETGPNTVLANPVFGQPQPPNPMPGVFVLMPFSEELRPVYEDHIKVVASQLGLTAVRADDFFAARSIVSDIWNAIYSSRIVIADCTGRNPNVFYEIGIAHTIGKPTILISQDIEDVPFDLRHIRSIVYQYTPRGMGSFNKTLHKALEAEKSSSINRDT